MTGTTGLEPDLSIAEREQLGHIAYFLAEWHALHDRGLIDDGAHAAVAAEYDARRSAIRGRGLYRAALGRAQRSAAKYTAEALAWARQAAEYARDQPDAAELVVALLERLGRHDEALAYCEDAAERLPVLHAHGERLRRAIAAQRECESRRATEPEFLPVPVPVAANGVPKSSEPLEPAGPAEPPLTWHNVAAEFLLDHWQKLILGLAVLLIVVSSNVGVYQLVGPKLWRPEGKCLLALVYTALCAGFGAGLLRWGAERAGRVMLLTTLIVVPANFMLVGQIRLLLEPTAFGLAIALLDAAALFALVRAVTATMGLQRGGLFLTVALLAVSGMNAVTSRGTPFAWGFAGLIAPAAVYLGAIVWLNTRYRAESAADAREFVHFALLLLTFAFLSGAVRSGVYVLRPAAPFLFAVPAMLLALACAHTGYHLGRLEKDPRNLWLLRFAATVLAGLAFALALSRPPGASPLLSGNTLATALLGLVLFAALLAVDRHPAFLYLAFASLFVAYFGAYAFLLDVIRAVDAIVAGALGYRQRLPFAFRSLNGLVFNTLLALLAVRFTDRWRDERLARHCHWLGLPLSIAACALACFEPKAAVLCLSGYTVLYAAAVWRFAAPRVVYLACAAAVGTAFFGTYLVPWTTAATYALVLVGGGWLFWALALGLRLAGVARAYRRPLRHAAILLSAATLAVGVGAGTTPVPVIALILATGLCVLLYAEEPQAPVAYLAALGGNLAYAWLAACGAERWGWTTMPGPHAVAFAVIAVGLAGLATSLRRAADAVRPLWNIALVEVALVMVVSLAAFGACLLWPSPAAWGTLGLALGLATLALVVVSAWGRESPGVAGWAVALGAAAYMAGVSAIVVQYMLEPWGGWAAVSLGLLALAQHAIRRAVAGGRGDSLYGPTLRFGSLLAVAATWSAAAACWSEFAFVAIALGCAGLALVALTSEHPRPVLAYWALLTLAAVWLSIFEITAGGVAALPSTYALWLATLALVLIVAAERGAPAREGHEPSRRRLFADSAPPFALATVAVSVALVAWEHAPSATGAAALAVASVTVLWATRRHRELWLVDSGIALAVAAALVTSVSRTAGAPVWVALGAAAGTTAACALVLLAVQRLACRGRSADLYGEPLCRAAGVLAAAVYALAIGTRLSFRGAYPVAAGVLLVDVLVGVWLATIARSARWTLGAAFSFVTAVYVVLFSVGRPEPRLAYVLGLAAVMQAIALWSVASLCRARLRAEWEPVFAVPLFAVALVLTLLAVPPAYHSPPTMLLVAVAFLLFSRRFPHAGWLYPAFGTLAAAAYYGWLEALAAPQRIAAVVGAAYAAWALGVLVRRKHCEVRWEAPCFHTAIVLGALSAVLQAAESVAHGLAWNQQAALAFVLSLLCLLMLTPYPRREWAHGSAAFFVAGLAMLAAPHMVRPVAGLLVAAVAANVLAVLHWAVRGCAPALERYVPDEAHAFRNVPAAWSVGLFLCTAALAGGHVAGAVLSTVTGELLALDPSVPAWWTVLLTLALSLVHLALLGPERGSAEARFGRWVGVVLVVWWLGCPPSPVLSQCGISAQTYLPLATGACALVLAAASVRSRDGRELLAMAVALAGALLTRGAVVPATVGALLLGGATFASVSLRRRRTAEAYAAAAHATGACVYAALVAATWLGRDAPADRLTAVALGGLAAVYGLVAAASGLRRAQSSLSLALERSALLSAVLPLAAVLGARTLDAPCGEPAALIGTGILMALSLVALVLAARWRAEPLVYVGQGIWLGAYYAYRTAFDLPPTTDAAVLTLFGYLDLAAAEVMQRLGLNLYARPTFYISLVLPLVPLVTALADGRTDDMNLLFLFTAATFYAVACYRVQWKRLGYAAAILYNVFLWIFWARAGYRLADQTPFFLVPVGFTAILFAEVNRAELGRSYVNAIRGIGLVLVYLSLALPIWQTASFGAWLTLLLLSLAGVFAGIGLRVQSFLWLGLVCFVLDVVYELGRLGAEHALARWAIMLALGVALVVFVALNEKKRIVATMRDFYAEIRQWE